MKATNRRRTKCFTGCWTCRSRRVKCDEETPTCQRCRQLGVRCEGYGIRLNWIHSSGETIHDDDDVQIRDAGSSRRFLTYLEASPMPRLSSPELDVALAQIDDWTPNESAGLTQEGFSVFSVDMPSEKMNHGQGRSSPVSSPYGHREHSEPEVVGPIGNLSTESTPVDATSHVDEDGVSDQRLCLDTVPVARTLLRLGGDSNRAQQSAASTDTDTFPVYTHNQQYGNRPPRHLDVLSLPGSQKRLIHHWVTFTSRKIALLDEPHNPCRTLMLPMALKGLNARSDDSNADVATFHAVCASAAYNLFELGGRSNEQDRALALMHDQQAIHHLRHSLNRADEHRDESSAMAIMACIGVEAISGTTQRWRTHVSGGLAYLTRLYFQGVGEAVLSAFQRHMVSMAILCDFPVADELKTFLHEDSVGDNLEFTFPYYGISRSFLRAQDQMNMFSSPNTPPPTRPTEKELDDFELQLYLAFPTCAPRNAPTSETQSRLVHHVAKAFYYGSLVFFQRSIRKTPPSESSLQALVELGVRELETLRRVGGDELGSIMLWPVLVIGSECISAELQKRMLSWFQDQRKLGFRNVVVLEELVREVWHARSRTGRNLDWRDLIVQSRFDVFRL